METNFRDLVRSMTAKEIILAMVDSLIPPPLIPIEMGTFGNVYAETISKEKKIFGFTYKPAVIKKTCFGCAATNTICKIAGKTFTELNIGTRGKRANFLNTSFDFLEVFEDAIDSLRRGLIDNYNSCAILGGFAVITNNGTYLPRLNNEYTIEDLEAYKRLADAQK